VAIGDLYQVNCQCMTAGTKWTWIFQYKMTAGAVVPNMLEELAIAFNLAFQGEFAAMSADDVFWTYTEAFALTKNGDIPGSAPVILPGGSFGGEAIPSNMAQKCIWQTNAPNSKHNGSTSFSNVSTGGQANGILSAPQVTATQALLTKLKDSFVAIGSGAAEFAPVIVSRFLDGVKRVPPVAFDILGSALSTRIGNMRRRITDARSQAVP